MAEASHDSSSPHESAGTEIDPLGTHAREAAALISKLTQIGLDRLNIPLPKCVVLGQQSTGKSSVIEALTGIRTPRDTGTCTRCPLMIDLQPSDNPQAEWNAEIYLQQRYHWDPQAKPDVNNKYPAWIQKSTPETKPFIQTNDSNQLEWLIKRAQQATLSPAQDPQSFLDTSFDFDSSIHRCLFSPNVVGIRITKYGLPALSFYDLPGLISQAETVEEEYTVPLVENLVSEYIASPDTLVLVTCALENDIANSTAAALARKQKATGRCVGVLTKPDRLPQGSSSTDLINLLENKRFSLGHGYHVVKNLDQHQILQGISHQDARTLEAQFFQTQDPWANDLQVYRQQFGTLNLQSFLSRQHAKHALLKLPIIQQDIDTRLQNINEELNRLPEIPPHQAVRAVLDVLLSFSEEVRLELEGEYKHTTWTNTWQDVKTAFYDSLTVMKPKLSIGGKLDKNIYTQNLPGSSLDDSIEISDTESDKDDDSQSNAPGTPAKKRKLDETPQSAPSKKTNLPTRNRAAPVERETSHSGSQTAGTHKVFRLDEVRSDIECSHGGKIPGQVHHKVVEAMMVEPLQNWQASLNTFFHNFERLLKKRINTLFAKHFRDWKDSLLFREANLIVREMIDNNFSLQKSVIAAECLKDELQGPYIFHKQTFNDARTLVLESFQAHRVNSRIKTYLRDANEHAQNPRAKLTEEKLRNNDKLMSLINAEPYTIEIELIADITTYYEIATRRFHDAVCMRIESKVFKQLREELRNELDRRLGLSDGEHGPENAQRLLAESKARFNRRKDLVAKRNALLEGQRYVAEFQRKCESDETASHTSGTSLSDSSPSSRDTVLTPPVDEMDCKA